MAAYLVANFRITDEDGMQKYREEVIPQLMKAGCEFVASGDGEAAEGFPAPVVVILKFESMETGKKWYNSPEYQAIKHLRINATTDISVSWVEEFMMPS